MTTVILYVSSLPSHTAWLYYTCITYIALLYNLLLVIFSTRVRDMGSIPGLGRSPGGGHGNLLQYSCLENPMDRGAWQAIVHGVTFLK